MDPLEFAAPTKKGKNFDWELNFTCIQFCTLFGDVGKNKMMQFKFGCV